MTKMVHIWEVHCSSCGNNFKHEFRATDILRPHIFASLYFKCPSCGAGSFDKVTPIGKLTLDDWQKEHPDMGVGDLPEYGDGTESP